MRTAAKWVSFPLFRFHLARSNRAEYSPVVVTLVNVPANTEADRSALNLAMNLSLGIGLYTSCSPKARL